MNEKKNIINHLIQTHNFTKYLEIGVDDPEVNFKLINCPTKHSVDPCIEFDAFVDYKYPSDEFFFKLENGQLNLPPDYKWDIVFIDGLHISTQVERDFNNAFNHLILHTVGGMGATFDRIEDGICDLDWGLAVIHRGNQECCEFDNPFYEYRKFEENRKRYLNTINLEEFYQIYK